MKIADLFLDVIPVINSANKQSTLVNVASAAASTQYTVVLNAVLLNTSFTG